MANTKSRPEVLLVTPPLMDAFELPELGVPQLVGYLRNKGINVEQRDLNLELFTSFLGAERWRSLILSRLGPPSDVAWKCGLGDMLSHRIPDVASDGIEMYRRWVEASVKRLGLRSGTTVGEVAEAVSKPHDVWDSLFIDNIIDVYESPKIIGFSVIAPQQLVPTLRMARLAKDSWPSAFVVIGGSWVIAAERIIGGFLDRFPEIDGAILRRGEGPLLSLLEALRARASAEPTELADRPLLDVPNLVHKHGGEVVFNRLEAPVPLGDLPTPDFRGLLLERYPVQMLPVQTNSRCYWGKCVFCYHDSPLNGAGFRTPVQAADDFDLLGRQTGINAFFLADCAAPLKWMERFAKERIRRGSGGMWAAMCRAERDFTEDACRLLRQSGCTVLMIGLETVSPEGLERIRKGITVADVEHAARCCSAAGIDVHLFLLDFPTNSRAEFVATMDYVLSISHLIKDFTAQRFQLSMLSRVYEEPAILGITPLAVEGENLDVFDIPYRATDETDSAELTALVEDYRVRFKNQRETPGSPFVAAVQKGGNCGPN